MATTVSTILSQCLQIPVDRITPDLAINGAWQWDSIGHLELMMHLEENHGISITEDTILECSSVTGLCQTLGLDL